jgi:hypothetical protein
VSHARRRRTLRCSVLAASLAVLASFVVAPAAQAAPAEAGITTDASVPSEAPVTDAPTGTETTVSTAAPEPTAAPHPTGLPTPAADPAPATDPAPGDLSSGDTVVGELVQAWPDPTAEEHTQETAEGYHDEAPLSWIEPAEGDAVRVPTESLPDVAVGSTLAVTVGEEVVDEASAEQGFEPAVEVQAATVVAAATADPTTASAGSTPTNTVTAVLVLPAGASSDGMTISSVVGTLNGAVSSFWDEQSNGTVRITAVQGAAAWVRSSQTCASPYALWDDVAAQIGWTGGAGKHLMLYVPANAPGCSYGLGTVGSSIGSGGRSYVQASALSVMAHELGHNFGLGHSSELQCNASMEYSSCTTRSYYDFYDVMGISWGQVGTLNTAQAARLGLLPAGEQVALTPSTAARTVTLVPVSAASGVRAVKLTAGDGTVYYLEYRQASGQDAWLGDSRNAYRLDSGVVLRRASSADGNTSVLLDGSPSPSSGWALDLQQALPVGVAVPVGIGDFSVAVNSLGATGAVVRFAGQGVVAAVNRTPVGSMEAVSLSGRTLSVSGWALDLDTPSTSIPVHVYVDGVGVALSADVSRGDVGAVFAGAGAAHGFGWSTTVGAGAHSVCVYAIDSEGGANAGLACRTVTVQQRTPVGSVEAVSLSGRTLSVSGWALDLDTPSTSIPVHVYVDGVGVALSADVSRGDVGAVFAGAGAAHGFGWSTTVGAGAHSVCVYAIDSEGGANAGLACRTVTVQQRTPVGSVEAVSLSGRTLSVSGWALDLDTPSTSIPVHVYVDGVGVALSADVSRGDVGAVFAGAGAAHGFGWSTTVGAGAHSVCVYAIDSEGGANAGLACRTVTVQQRTPVGSVEAVSLSGRTLSVSGWALDLDTPSTSIPVHVYVDGVGVALSADVSRGDVGAVFAGAGAAHGFGWSTTVGAGAHSVCVYAIDSEGGANAGLACRTVTVP